MAPRSGYLPTRSRQSPAYNNLPLSDPNWRYKVLIDQLGVLADDDDVLWGCWEKKNAEWFRQRHAPVRSRCGNCGVNVRNTRRRLEMVKTHENYTHLYPNEQVAKAVSDYAYEHSTKLPKHIKDHHAWGSEHSVNPGYMISTLQQQFQIWIAKAIGAKRILEIGTYIGFSTMGWSEAVGPDGHVTALEFSPEFAKIAEDSFEKYGVKNAEVIVGDARESIKNLPSTLSAPYDLIFIDADKTSYLTYLSLILSLSSPNSTSTRLLRPGGIILADNILRRGLIADSTDANPFKAKVKEMGRWNPGDIEAMDAFNKALVGNERFETFLLPLFDGVGCARLKD